MKQWIVMVVAIAMIVGYIGLNIGYVAEAKTVRTTKCTKVPVRCLEPGKCKPIYRCH